MRIVLIWHPNVADTGVYRKYSVCNVHDMLAVLKNTAARGAACRSMMASVRTLTTESAQSAVQASSLPGAAPSTVVTQIPSVAGPSTISHAAPTSSTIHIPPAEDPLLHLFTSLVMVHGKRQEASRVVAKMLLHLHAFTKAPPLPILRQAVEIASPLLRCRSFKRAAKQFVFPMPLSERQRTTQAIRWIKEGSDHKGGKHLPERLAREVIAVIKGGDQVHALTRKKEVHKTAVLHRGNVARPPRVPKSNRG
ncbi:ribosomal protein S7 domain-containing protein [Daedaleopsis nitida]|nr:ribosomal protein S7 domain-containing protein [Daedaleopsis nitida]